jgi:hypothetical protein
MDIDVKGKVWKNYAFKNSISEVNAEKKFHISTETISLFVLDTFINGKLVQDIEMDTQEYFHLELL